MEEDDIEMETWLSRCLESQKMDLPKAFLIPPLAVSIITLIALGMFYQLDQADDLWGGREFVSETLFMMGGLLIFWFIRTLSGIVSALNSKYIQAMQYSFFISTIGIGYLCYEFIF